MIDAWGSKDYCSKMKMQHGPLVPEDSRLGADGEQVEPGWQSETRVSAAHAQRPEDPSASPTLHMRDVMIAMGVAHRAFFVHRSTAAVCGV